MASRDDVVVVMQRLFTENAEESVVVTKKDAQRMMGITLKAIAEVAMETGSIRTEIGTFKAKEDKERSARNPRTGVPVVVEARSKLAFKPSSDYVILESQKQERAKAAPKKAAPKAAAPKKAAVPRKPTAKKALAKKA